MPIWTRRWPDRRRDVRGSLDHLGALCPALEFCDPHEAASADAHDSQVGQDVAPEAIGRKAESGRRFVDPYSDSRNRDQEHPRRDVVGSPHDGSRCCVLNAQTKCMRVALKPNDAVLGTGRTMPIDAKSYRACDLRCKADGQDSHSLNVRGRG